MNTNPIDPFVKFAASHSARYWRFTIASISQYMVGRAFLGAETDFGTSPEAPSGAHWKPRRLGRTLEGDSGAVVTFDRGRTVHTITQRYVGLDDTAIAALRALRDLGTSILIYDIDDVARECIIPQDGGLTYDMEWGAPNLWTANVTWQELA